MLFVDESILAAFGWSRHHLSRPLDENQKTELDWIMSSSHVQCIVLVLIVIGSFASGLPLAGVGITCTGPYDVN